MWEDTGGWEGQVSGRSGRACWFTQDFGGDQIVLRIGWGG